MMFPTDGLQTVPRARWMRIIPPTIIIYIVAYMDRVNFGFAMAGGMNEALGMSATLSGIAARNFLLGIYGAADPEGSHVAEHGSARNFILWTIIGWGGISFLSGFVQNGWLMLVMRFLLGVAEGGLYPAILVLVGNWFPHKELGRANALFLTSAPLSNPSSRIHSPGGLSRTTPGAACSFSKALRRWR